MPSCVSQRKSVTAAVLVVLLTPMTAIAAETGPWFGIALPAGMGDRHAATVDVSNVQAVPAVVPAGEDNDLALQGEAIYPLVNEIVGFSRESLAEGNRIWGRVTGFPSAQRTLNWVAEEFSKAGLEAVQVQEYGADGDFWWPSDWEVRVLGNDAFGTGSADVVLESSLVTAGSEIPGGVMVAVPVYAGHISEPLPEIDVSGKIAIQVLTPESGAYAERTPTRERAQALMAKGAVAVLNVVEQTGNMHTRDFSNCNGPCYNIGTNDGRFLREVVARADQRGLTEQLRLQLSLDATVMTGLKGHNTVGIVPGASNENIIINAHADGWYDAAGDNADGLAVLIAMARHFAGAENRPARTLVFVASGGHHSPGLNGPGHFVTMNPQLTANTVLVINLEHIAQFQIDSKTWQVGPNEQPMNFGISNSAPFLTNLAVNGMQRYGFNLNPVIGDGVPGDLGGYRPLDVAMVQAIHSGPMYHASGDVAETISVPGLERAARFYTYFVEQAAAAERNQINPN